jgi:hypothetical protein
MAPQPCVILDLPYSRLERTAGGALAALLYTASVAALAALASWSSVPAVSF